MSDEQKTITLRSRIDLAKLRALYEATTVGLLIETGNGAIAEADELSRAARDPQYLEPLAIIAGNLDLDKAAALARLLVEAHNALPGLLDEIERLQTHSAPLTEEQTETLISTLRARPPFDGDGDLLRALRAMKGEARRVSRGETHRPKPCGS